MAGIRIRMMRLCSSVVLGAYVLPLVCSFEQSGLSPMKAQPQSTTTPPLRTDHQHHLHHNNIRWSSKTETNPLHRKSCPLWSSEQRMEQPPSETPPKRQKRRLRPFNPKSILRELLALQAALRKRFWSLSRRAKAVVTLQVFALGFLGNVAGSRVGMDVGSVGRSVSRRVAGRAVSGKVASRPVEVPYSVFMDFVEQSGKGHTPGRNPAMKLSQMTIGKERIGFRVDQDTPKHQLALSDKKLVTQQDISVQAVQSRIAYTTKVNASPDLIQFLRHNSIPFQASSTRRSSLLLTLARSSIFFLYMLFLLRMYRTMSGGGGFGGGSDVPGKLAGVRLRRGRKQKGAAAAEEAENRVTFDDIEGIDDAKFEVMELVDALRNPGKYSILGARAPTGLLLEGPPGTGKTMLAKACATTAGVPLLYCSGSDFVEMFVGRGAARVRKTFERAGKIAPCIIFIDELDALGKSRAGAGLDGFMGGAGGRSNDEAEQTLNQLLTCMDGLDSFRGICVLAATNRKDVLDPALIRPGRFDRLVKVTLPDADGRERILRVHAKRLPGFTEGSGVDEKRLGSLGKGKEIDLGAVAAVTPGLSGAELEFVVNEAAIRAVRRVSQALRDNQDAATIVPQVNAEDFEMSVRNYYETRKGGAPGGKMSDVLNNVLRPR